MSYKCENCGHMEITDGFVVMELGRCQKAFNEQQKKFNKLLEFVKKITDCTIESFRATCHIKADAKELLKEMGETNDK